MTAPSARERDPHFRKIVEGLDGPLDRDRFEECVQDLLRQDFPGLTDVYGGSDGGMDGAIPDGENEPFALVVTTAKNVIRNLTRSLDRRIQEGDSRRKAVLATSQALTPRRRKNLRERAREKDFVLVQIFERRDIASRLYRDSKWTRLLLDITGEPSALSAVPKTRRPLLDVDLVGRAEDLAWLRETTGDRLLVGEPGSGKTSLLLQLVEDGTALFLSDIEGFAEAFRDSAPEIVVVDDAHVEPDRLDRLRQIRRGLHAEDDFSIVATSWKGDREEVMDALGGISKEQVHTLELLTRSEIVEVFRQIGLDLPADNPYLADLVTQAANRPGLAVTLGRAWLGGNYDEVLTGQAIYRSVVPFLKRTLDDDPEQFLAAFALGGDRGMGLTAVAGFLGEPPGRVRDMAARVGASGILTVRGKDEQGEVVLAVNPPQLRVPLLNKIFFGEFPGPWQDLVQHAPSLRSVIETLLLASQRKVLVPRGEVQELLKEAGPRADWGAFALLGEDEAHWTLRNYPGSPVDIASAALQSAPRTTIRRLLREAKMLERTDRGGSRSPMDLLKAWVCEISDVDWPGAVLRRKRILIDEALQGMDKAIPARFALRAAFMALHPGVERYRRDVAGGDILWRRRWLPVASLGKMLTLWEELQEVLPRLCLQSWRELDKVLHQWIRPYPEVTAEKQEEFHQFARIVVKDLSAIADGRLGLQAALRKKAWEVGLDLDLAGDPLFKALYPQFGFGQDERETPEQALQHAEDTRKQTLRKLGRAWAKKPVSEALDDLAHYGEEASWLPRSADPSPDFVAVIAQVVSAPEEWLTKVLDREERVEFESLVAPLLARVVEEERPGWRGLLERCLASDAHGLAAAEHVLRGEEPSEQRLKRAFAVVTPQSIETLTLRGEVPTPILRRLLRSTDPNLALAAAIGEWLCEPRQVVREELNPSWRAAILDAGGSVDRRPSTLYWLRSILRQDPDLALDWITRNAADEEGKLGLQAMEAAYGPLMERPADMV